MEKNDLVKTRIVDIHIRKKGFPAGIFLLAFLMLSLALTAAVLSYFVYVGRQRIGDIETYTRNYSISLVNTFAGAAELGYRRGAGDRLAVLFGEKTGENTYDEAFFVLRDGTLVVHSIPDVARELRGNILNDEISYNRDLILKPLVNGRNVQFSDYNIVAKRVPFNRMQRSILKDYLWRGVDTSGWLVSKPVFQKNEPIGTVNLLIGKDRIFEFIRAQVDETVWIFAVSIGIAFMISLAMSLVIFIRYRSIQRDTLAMAEEKFGYRMEDERDVVLDEELQVEEEAPVPAYDEVPVIEPPQKERTIAVELFDEVKEREASAPGRVIDLYSLRRERDAGTTETPPKREIKEAVPIDVRRRT